MTLKEKHVHKLKRHRYKNGSSIFFCTDESCSFKTDTKLALGKGCICWRCGNKFNINQYSIRLDRPHCDDCQRTRHRVTERRVAERRQDVSTATNVSEVNEATKDLREKLSQSIMTMMERSNDSTKKATKPDSDI